MNGSRINEGRRGRREEHGHTFPSVTTCTLARQEAEGSMARMLELAVTHGFSQEERWKRMEAKGGQRRVRCDIKTSES